MKTFLNEDFLLTSETAKRLYHDYAKDLPIIDYHCHINPKEIAENKQYDTLTEVWLGGDHYKWRQIRSNGIAEEYVTGDASDLDKFKCWAKTLNKLIGNPLYHWSYLELKNYFDYTGVLNEENAEEVFELCNKRLQSDDMKVQSIIKNSNVEALCTTDDPIDSLEYHKAIKEDDAFDVTVLPTFRPDKALNIDLPTFKGYIQQLGEVTGQKIDSLDQLVSAVESRIDFFAANGCKVSDHALTYCFYSAASKEEVEQIFTRGLVGETLSTEEVEKFKTYMLLFLGEAYSKRGWTMQIHFGCQRDNNTRMFEKLGPDTGYDAIYTDSKAAKLAELFDALEKENNLPKTIIYSLNPYDNEAILTMMGCFQSDEVEGKVQHGSAWWFNDTKTGMIKQLTDLANLGMLANFVGMLTDSRSFLSYARHEYFRRILCELIGGWAENGEVHNDMDTLGKIVQDICYYNAKDYFNL